MKKLLVILLLLFPFQGAWAKVFHLDCKAKDSDATSSFIIDTKKKTATNLQGHVIEMKVTELSYIWLSFNEESDNKWSVIQAILNRHTAELDANLYYITYAKMEELVLKYSKKEELDLNISDSDFTVKYKCKKLEKRKF